MKKQIFAIILSIIMIISMFVIGASATEIADINTEYPNINVKVIAPNGSFDNLDTSKVKATINGKELTFGEINLESESTEWIVMIDATKSISSDSFNKQKNSIKSLLNSLGSNDKLVLFTFDTDNHQILDGSESKDDALKKIDAIKCDGEDTNFYGALNKLIELVNSSDSDKIVPIMITDGVDTISTIKMEDVKKNLKESAIPVYGLYPAGLSNDKIKAFNDLLSASQGKATAFKSNGKLADVDINDTANLSFTCNEPIDSNENVVFSLDLGDGKVTEKEFEYKNEEPAEDETNAPEENTEDITNNEETIPDVQDVETNSFNPLFIVIPILIIVAIILVLLKKKKSANKNPENNSTELEADEVVKSSEEAIAVPESKEEKNDDAKAKSAEEKAAKKAKKAAEAEQAKRAKQLKKEQQQFQFYFVDKNSQNNDKK